MSINEEQEKNARLLCERQGLLAEIRSQRERIAELECQLKDAGTTIDIGMCHEEKLEGLLREVLESPHMIMDASIVTLGGQLEERIRKALE